jgi:hypothetical protein
VAEKKKSSKSAMTTRAKKFMTISSTVSLVMRAIKLTSSTIITTLVYINPLKNATL